MSRIGDNIEPSVLTVGVNVTSISPFWLFSKLLFLEGGRSPEIAVFRFRGYF